MKFEKILVLSGGRVAAYEVLHKDLGGAINKEKVFAQLDEEEDLRVFLHHIKELKRLAEENRLPSPPRFFLNLKPSTLALFYKEIRKEVESCPFSLVLELREDWIEEKHLEKLMSIRNSWRFFLSLDDFGRQASNVDRYVKLKPEFTKLDLQAFNGASHSFILLLMEALQKTNKTIFVAEKVEREEQFRLVKSLGIGYAQGYLFERKVEKERHETSPR